MYWGDAETRNKREKKFCNMIAKEIYNSNKREIIKFIAMQVESCYDARAKDIEQTMEHVCSIYSNDENDYYTIMDVGTEKYIEQAVREIKYRIIIKINKKLARLRKINFLPDADFLSYQNQIFDFNCIDWLLEKGFIYK